MGIIDIQVEYIININGGNIFALGFILV